MSSEEHHVALPKLYGAPAYARPGRSVEEIERPIDPDDLPLETLRTPEEQELAARIVGAAYCAPTFSGPTNGHDQAPAPGSPLPAAGADRPALREPGLVRPVVRGGDAGSAS